MLLRERLPKLVFYHGETEWKIPNEFMAIVDAEAGWHHFLLNFRFPVVDLGQVPDHRLIPASQIAGLVGGGQICHPA